MPFGLKNAPPTFQRAMDITLRGCEGFAVVYIDDILMFSGSEDKYLRYLNCVFECLREYSFHVRFPKCELMRSSVEFLGHRLSEQGLTTAPDKVQVL